MLKFKLISSGSGQACLDYSKQKIHVGIGALAQEDCGL